MNFQRTALLGCSNLLATSDPGFGILLPDVPEITSDKRTTGPVTGNETCDNCCRNQISLSRGRASRVFGMKGSAIRCGSDGHGKCHPDWYLDLVEVWLLFVGWDEKWIERILLFFQEMKARLDLFCFFFGLKGKEDKIIWGCTKFRWYPEMYYFILRQHKFLSNVAMSKCTFPAGKV